MFDISLNHIITINRGESGSFTIPLNKGTSVNPEIVELDNDFDTIYFGVMQPENKFEFSIVRKLYHREDLNEDGTLTITFEPNDSELLLPGNYFYEVKVKKYDLNEFEQPEKEHIYTVVPRTKFIILE